MKIAGIIAEYNPFHNGHEYHIEQTKKLTNCDYVIIILSGDFTQRGIPAFINKHKRAEMALLSGADLVIELPIYYSCSSAQYFALGATHILNSLNCIDYLSFGSECGDINTLKDIALLLTNEDAHFSQLLKENLKSGLPYPRAFSVSFSVAYQDKPEYCNIISSPNNLLGIEYLKSLITLNSNIEPFTITRNGADYLDDNIETYNSSALAIRSSILTDNSLDGSKDQMPVKIHELLMSEYKKTFPISLDDYSQPLLYKLLNQKNNTFTEYLDIDISLSNKIKNNICNFTNFSSFAELLKTKEYSYARICRCLVQILLNIKKSHLRKASDSNIILPNYARILGFNSSKTELLSIIKSNCNIPLISKLSNADKILGGNSLQMLEHDILASNIYHTACTCKYGSPAYNAYCEQIIKI